MRALILSFAALAAGASTAQAADSKGRFAVDGPGAAPCSLYLDARAKKDNRYFAFGGWIDGFTSAMNIYERDTFDITPWQSTDLLAAALAERCKANPRQNVQQAFVQVTAALMAGRLRTRSPMTLAGDPGDSQTTIYEATMRAVQARLGVAQSGTLDRPTRNALNRFQKGRGIPQTGVPDQITLYLLLGETPRKR